MSEWISVDDQLPEENEYIICSGFKYNDPAKGRWVSHAFRDGKQFYSKEDDMRDGGWLYPPTHWMSFPEPPK